MIPALTALMLVLTASGAVAQDGEAGFVWTDETLFAYLAAPQAVPRKSPDDSSARAKMRFRLSGKRDRRDAIAYSARFFPEQEPAITPAATEAAALETADNALCVRNLDESSHFFAVETSRKDRRTGTLPPGKRLCITAAKGETGLVQVFDNADGFEGCSRLVQVGQTEDLLKYVDFDRCFWGSNT
jgi:hypothetical protein